MYASVYIDCEKASVPFYTQYLNLTLHEHVKLSADEEWWVLRETEKEKTGLILIKAKSGHKGTLVLNTSDCILAYCRLKEMGIKDLSKPLYSSIGLLINFSDPSGNTVMFLEERNYSELAI